MNKIHQIKAGILLAIVTSIIALFVGPGCSSIPQETKITRMKGIAELAAFTGATVDLRDNPDHKPFYVASVAALDSLLKSQDYSPVKFTEALNQLPIKQLSSSKGDLIVGVAVILWDQYLAEMIHVDQTVYVAPVMTAVRNGLNRAIANTN